MTRPASGQPLSGHRKDEEQNRIPHQQRDSLSQFKKTDMDLFSCESFSVTYFSENQCG